jgi:hypothetical protein
MTREELCLAVLVLVLWLLGGLILAGPRGRRIDAAGIVGALLVSTGCWGALLLAYLVGSR